MQTKKLLNDERFVEAYIEMRMQRGYGPLRISAELKERGIDALLVDEKLNQYDNEVWRALIIRVRHKKFGLTVPRDVNECARQMRFLQYRGFHQAQIKMVFKYDIEQY